eukprot:3221098-Lingulodinium_polyedra.AAC.1
MASPNLRLKTTPKTSAGNWASTLRNRSRRKGRPLPNNCARCATTRNMARPCRLNMTPSLPQSRDATLLPATKRSGAP